MGPPSSKFPKRIVGEFGVEEYTQEFLTLSRLMSDKLIEGFMGSHANNFIIEHAKSMERKAEV